MSSSPVKPWSHDPNAPQISYELYLSEKYNFAGTLISAMLYGTLIHPFVDSSSSRLFVYRSRDCHPPLLPMCYRIAQSRQSRRGWRQVGTHGSHCCPLLACHDIHWDESRHSVYFLRRLSRDPSHRRLTSRTSRIPTFYQLQRD